MGFLLRTCRKSIRQKTRKTKFDNKGLIFVTKKSFSEGAWGPKSVRVTVKDGDLVSLSSGHTPELLPANV